MQVIIHTCIHYIVLSLVELKGIKVQTLGARALAGAWCMAGCLGHNYYGHRTAN